jgi:tryptophan synthase beta chain
LCGHGHLDLAAYENYLAGKMEDYDLSAEELADAMKTVPSMA